MILKGIKIIDFTHVWQGPVATQILADFGADIIKIEHPHKGDWTRAFGPYAGGLSLVFAGLNRNKRSLSIDIKKQEGREILHKLVADADVLVHNFRVGVPERIGLDYDTVKKIAPKIIYACSSGWGEEGPCVQRKRGGHDKMASAESGLFHLISNESLPIPESVSVDYPAGMLLTLGILLGIYHRNKTGEGQKISTDLLSAGIFANLWDSAPLLNR